MAQGGGEIHISCVCGQIVLERFITWDVKYM
jgi:hypothetical protein